MNNLQEPEKQAKSDGTFVAVHSIFHTIQGEGPFAGSPAVFVRLAGCNLQCPLCDTDYTSNRVPMRPGEISTRVGELILENTLAYCGEPEFYKTFCDLVVISGGEPFRQTIGPLIAHLIREGFRVQVETNGSLFDPTVNYSDERLTIVCSPKTGQVNRNLLPYIKAFKYVATAASLAGSEDGLPALALEHTAAPRLYRPPADHPAEIYLQPVDERDIFKDATNLKAVVESCLLRGYRLCLQVHKIIGVE